MSERPLAHADAQLIGLARAFRPDSRLDVIADRMDANDVEAWERLHPRLIERADDYRHFRAAHREAFKRGLINDNEAATPPRKGHPCPRPTPTTCSSAPSS